ncbi:MAG: LytTR family transcriptional regulator [Prevotella sp.]|nr:LytTR family transcriptional regulator [Prevotella sp.]
MRGNIYFFLRRKIHFPDAKSRWIIIIFITFWVFLILYSLQPFGINFAKNKFTITALNTIGVFSICTVCIQGLPLIFRKYYVPDRWTNGKFLGFCLTVITAFSVLETLVVSIYVDGLEGYPYYAHFSIPQRFFMFYKAVIFVAAFPISIIYYILVKRKNEEEQETQMQAVAHIMPASGEKEEDYDQVIELSGKTKDYIRLLPEDILYVKASGNYVAVYYLKNGKEDHKLLRISMSEFGDSLCDYLYIIRCHRAFMVNIKKVEKIHGNLKGYHMELKNTETKIPVSKSYTRIVKEKIMYADI